MIELMRMTIVIRCFYEYMEGGLNNINAGPQIEKNGMEF